MISLFGFRQSWSWILFQLEEVAGSEKVLALRVEDGKPVSFRPGLVALVMPGPRAVDCIAILEASVNTSLVILVNQSKERRQDNTDASALTNVVTIKEAFAQMQKVVVDLDEQFTPRKKHKVVVDVFDDRDSEPEQPLVNLEDVKDVTYFITRQSPCLRCTTKFKARLQLTPVL